MITNAKKLSKKSGFSMLELVIVIMIMTTLAGIMSMSFLGASDSAKRGKAEIEMEGILKAIEVNYIQTGVFPAVGPANGAGFPEGDNLIAIALDMRGGNILYPAPNEANIISPWGGSYVVSIAQTTVQDPRFGDPLITIPQTIITASATDGDGNPRASKQSIFYR